MSSNFRNISPCLLDDQVYQLIFYHDRLAQAARLLLQEPGDLLVRQIGVHQHRAAHLAVDLDRDGDLGILALALLIGRPLGHGADSLKALQLPQLVTDMGGKGAQQLEQGLELRPVAALLAHLVHQRHKDGNGRVGRLWHTLLLSKWNSVFAWLSVESIIHDHQQEYYDAINASNDAGESTAFIEFMLSAIKASLIDAIHTSDTMSDGKMDKKALRWQKIEQFLQTHEYIMNADVRELCGVSAATANRILTNLVDMGDLIRIHTGGHWQYRVK
mgnify:CR=1 FL=1